MLQKHETIFKKFKRSIIFVLVASTIVSFLMLTSPFFMLLLYDRAVPSNSVETLGVLTLLAILLFGFYGMFDYLRGRVLARIGATIQTELDGEFLVDLNKPGNSKTVQTAIKDLERVKNFLSSPVAIACIDIFWSPLFIVISFIFNVWLGWFSVISIAILTALAILNQRLNQKRLEEAQQESQLGENYAREYIQNSTIISAMGMKIPLAKRWLEARESATTYQIESADWVGGFSALSKSLRMVAQSGILALGAYLAIKSQIPPGMMIAGSILLGRTLAPIDQVIGQWRAVEEGARAWRNVNKYYNELYEQPPTIELPEPQGHIRFAGVYATYANPREPVLSNINFEVQPGQALGVIGASASGKSSLALTLLGVLPAMSGRVEIDGASINQYDHDSMGRYFGYLPQEVSLLSGTIAENIARFEHHPNRDAEVVKAAKAAGAHELITAQKEGYNTFLPGALSGGQKQRVALARALYGEPPILLFDEPNSNLDAEGTAALNAAILDAKQKHKTVIIVAHRPAAIQECDLILMLNNGRMQDFGPRDEVLERQVQNFKLIKRAQNAN